MTKTEQNQLNERTRNQENIAKGNKYVKAKVLALSVFPRQANASCVVFLSFDVTV